MNTIDKLNKYMITAQSMEDFKKRCGYELPVIINEGISNSYSAKPQYRRVCLKHASDKLFWCFYILCYGYDAYNLCCSGKFATEKQIKIETVEKISKDSHLKEQFKAMKIKISDIETDLVNSSIISSIGLIALCITNKISLVYFSGRIYSIIGTINNGNNSEEISDNLTNINATTINDTPLTLAHLPYIEHTADNNYMAYLSGDPYIDLSTLDEHYYLIENIQKPIKPASAYTSGELIEMCKKMKLDVYSKEPTKTGKPKQLTKPELYLNIQNYIHI